MLAPQMLATCPSNSTIVNLIIPKKKSKESHLRIPEIMTTSLYHFSSQGQYSQELSSKNLFVLAFAVFVTFHCIDSFVKVYIWQTLVCGLPENNDNDAS